MRWNMTVIRLKAYGLSRDLFFVHRFVFASGLLPNLLLVSIMGSLHPVKQVNSDEKRHLGWGLPGLVGQ